MGIAKQPNDLDGMPGGLTGIYGMSSPPLVILDSDGVITHVADPVPPMWGYQSSKKLIGRRAREFWVEKREAQAASAEYQRVGHWQGTFLSRRRDGSSIQMYAKAWMIRTRGNVAQTVLVVSPSADRQDVFSLFGRHRMVAIPEVVIRGVVHDINNALTLPVGTLTYLRCLKSLDGADARDMVESAAEACEYAAAITRQMGDWLRTWMDTAGERQPISLDDVVSTALRMATGGSHVTVTRHVEPDLMPVPGQKAGIFRVFLNLALNARQAMNSMGRLQVRMENVVHPGPAGTRLFARVSLTDSGPGIAPEDRARLFQMGFSTKTGDRGVGLAISNHIVQEHGGWIDVESQEGRGTTFRVWLPVEG
jgi:PAS domain S-box-containing protein